MTWFLSGIALVAVTVLRGAVEAEARALLSALPRRIVWLAAVALPRGVRGRYRDEWHADLDMEPDRPLWQLVLAIRIVLGLPRMCWTLWPANREAVAESPEARPTAPPPVQPFLDIALRCGLTPEDAARVVGEAERQVGPLRWHDDALGNLVLTRLIETFVIEHVLRSVRSAKASSRRNVSSVPARLDGMSGDEDFDGYVRARYDRLCRVAYVLCGDRHRAEDLVQTALAKTYEARRRRGVDNLDAYVHRTLVTTQASWWRRRWHGEVSTGALPDVAADDAYSDTDTRATVLAALGRLPSSQRAVLALRYLEALSEQETAQALGCAVGTVKSRAARGLAALREAGLLTDLEPAERGGTP